MTPIRQQIGVGYKTLVKKTLVQALRSVFIANYQEDQFADLRISLDFPLTKEQYPAVYIRYNGSEVTNSGVGHEEVFRDPEDNIRLWYHRHFAGTIDFNVYALTPLDRDVLSDAIVEILSFGWLDTVQSEFYDTLYGDVFDPYSILTLLNQVTVHTDRITPGGESAGPAPWEPEDTLIYQDTYSVPVSGGFYNSLPDVVTDMVAEVILDEAVIDTDLDETP